MVNQLSLVLFNKCEQGLFLALGVKPVEFCLASVSRYCSLLWVVNQLSLVLFGKCEQVLLLALGG